MNNLIRNVVSSILLIPTTVASALLSALLFVVASVGAPVSVLLVVLVVVWAANIAMWCLFLRALSQEQEAITLVQRWRYFLIFGANLGLIAYVAQDPGGEEWGRVALAWAALTLVYFIAVVYRIPRRATA